MRLVASLGAIFAVGFAGVGCQGPLKDYPPISGCPVASHTCTPGGGGGILGAGGSSSSSSSGAGGSIDQLGTVGSITSPSFAPMMLPTFSGPALIHALPSVGGQFTAPYPTAIGAGGGLGVGGSASSDTFDLVNLPQGPAWFLVQDTSNGVTGIDSTYSPAVLPAFPSITLPVVEQQVLTNIASNLPSVQAHGGVSTLAAHVVLVVTHAAAPFPGVSVTGGAGGAEIVYDIGLGTYSDTATATGSGGTIILFNAALSGAATIDLLSPTMAPSQVTVQTGPGVVTLASVVF